MRLSSWLLAAVSTTRTGRASLCSICKGSLQEDMYRSDGVRITHDPFAPGMVEKYGQPGATDAEGFDPYKDTVGPGIYGGIVKRENGQVIVGKQYQNHNPRPGPVYAGGGYTPAVRALSDLDKLRSLLAKYPDLSNDISTGGALPLHMCGMSRRNQAAVPILVAAGADIEALDTYGMTPLHRMASNNLAEGAQALLEAGASPLNKGGVGETPAAMAKDSRALDVLRVLERWGDSRRDVPIRKIVVLCELADVSGEYSCVEQAEPAPPGFDNVCRQMGWNAASTWRKLNSGRRWFRMPNGAYIYFNSSDRHWWIDAPDGRGVFKAPGPEHAPPAGGWKVLDASVRNAPSFVGTYRELVA